MCGMAWGIVEMPPPLVSCRRRRKLNARTMGEGIAWQDGVVQPESREFERCGGHGVALCVMAHGIDGWSKDRLLMR